MPHNFWFFIIIIWIQVNPAKWGDTWSPESHNQIVTTVVESLNILTENQVFHEYYYVLYRYSYLKSHNLRGMSIFSQTVP